MYCIVCRIPSPKQMFSELCTKTICWISSLEKIQICRNISRKIACSKKVKYQMVCNDILCEVWLSKSENVLNSNEKQGRSRLCGHAVMTAQSFGQFRPKEQRIFHICPHKVLFFSLVRTIFEYATTPLQLVMKCKQILSYWFVKYKHAADM